MLTIAHPIAHSSNAYSVNVGGCDISIAAALSPHDSTWELAYARDTQEKWWNFATSFDHFAQMIKPFLEHYASRLCPYSKRTVFEGASERAQWN